MKKIVEECGEYCDLIGDWYSRIICNKKKGHKGNHAFEWED